MIFVDSSVWIDYFSGKATRETDLLDDKLGIEPVLIGDLVIAEVLQGFRLQGHYVQARQLLTSLTVITVGGPEIAIQSAENYRFLKSKGATIRKTIDALIATRCIVDGYSLLHCDRDFQPFVDHLQLQSAI